LLQGFPPRYVFEGPFDDGFKQVGNAVSPVVAEKLGKFVGTKLVQGSLSEFLRGVPPITVDRPIGPGFAVTINGIKRQREKLRAAA